MHQKIPTLLPKETYSYANKGLLLCQKRPTNTPKETWRARVAAMGSMRLWPPALSTLHSVSEVHAVTWLGLDIGFRLCPPALSTLHSVSEVHRHHLESVKFRCGFRLGVNLV